jgi:hypothetical protein
MTTKEETRFNWRATLMQLSTLPMSPSSLKARLVNSLAEYIEGLERSLASRERVIDSVERAVKKEATRVREVTARFHVGHGLDIEVEREDTAWFEDIASRAQRGRVRLGLRPKPQPEKFDVIFVGFEDVKPSEEDLKPGDWIGTVHLEGFDGVQPAARFLVLSEQRIGPKDGHLCSEVTGIDKDPLAHESRG